MANLKSQQNHIYEEQRYRDNNEKSIKYKIYRETPNF